MGAAPRSAVSLLACCGCTKPWLPGSEEINVNHATPWPVQPDQTIRLPSRDRVMRPTDVEPPSQWQRTSRPDGSSQTRMADEPPPPVSFPPETSLENILDAELRGDFLYVDVPALERER